MIFAEAVGPNRFRQRVKIYATDVDEEALAQARQAAYGESDVEDVPAELRSRYFEHQGDQYLFRKDLRRSLIFGRNDPARPPDRRAGSAPRSPRPSRTGLPAGGLSLRRRAPGMPEL
jgi:chemotaxis methyl-accepting protein methylase